MIHLLGWGATGFKKQTLKTKAGFSMSDIVQLFYCQDLEIFVLTESRQLVGIFKQMSWLVEVGEQYVLGMSIFCNGKD